MGFKMLWVDFDSAHSDSKHTCVDGPQTVQVYSSGYMCTEGISSDWCSHIHLFQLLEWDFMQRNPQKQTPSQHKAPVYVTKQKTPSYARVGASFRLSQV